MSKFNNIVVGIVTTFLVSAITVSSTEKTVLSNEYASNIIMMMNSSSYERNRTVLYPLCGGRHCRESWGNKFHCRPPIEVGRYTSVSYTHLDVYKRQISDCLVIHYTRPAITEYLLHWISGVAWLHNTTLVAD